MELRSGRRLGSLPTPIPRRRRLSPDRMSALPDEMLLEILARLRCARAAAHTSGLSHRWRGLWRHLPELSFRDVSAHGVESALAHVTCPALSLLEVDIPPKNRSMVMDAAGVSALFRAAVRLAPSDLVISLYGDRKDWNVPIEIPRFERATSVKLRVMRLLLVPPAGGAEFPLLERLSVHGCRVDTAALVLRCPRLRVFEIGHDYFLGTVKVHSPTIEELVVEGDDLRNMDIMAPVLKRFSLSGILADDFTVSFSAPMVKNLSWEWFRYKEDVGFGEKWRMRYLKLEIKENVRVLHMSISSYFPHETPTANRSFSQEIAPLPAFSVLELHLEGTKRHVYGALVSHLLGICSTIRSLQVSIGPNWGKETCSPNCPCDQPQNWRNGIISLTALEEVKITGFGGADHEVDFLKLFFRCAPLMKRMTVGLAPDLLPTDEDCEEIYINFQANADAKWSIYRSSRED